MEGILSLRNVIVITVLAFALGVWPQRGTGQSVYWCNHFSGCLRDGISTARLDDATPGFLHPGRCSPIGLGVDEGTNTLYWGDDSGIFRSALNGDSIVAIVPRTMPGRPAALALDLVHERLYWTDWEFVDIFRANLDGTEPEPVVLNIGVSSVLHVDSAGDKLYWVGGGVTLFRANLDGTAIVPVRSALMSEITGLSVDPENALLYWSERDDGIRRANLDGSSPVTVVSGAALAMYLDLNEGKLYWSEPHAIMRANADGTDIEPVVAGLIGDVALEFPFWGLAVDARVPGDCDGNAAVDLGDLGTFAACLTGPGVDIDRGCGCADLDRNARTTLADFSLIQSSFGNE